MTQTQKINEVKLFSQEILFPRKKNIEKDLLLRADYTVWLRVAFLILAWLGTSITLTYYSTLLTKFVGKSSFGREFFICGGQIIFEVIILISTKNSSAKIMLYLSNMMSISFFGAIFLLPVLFLAKFLWPFDILFALLFFLLTALLMFIEHLRRMKILDLPKWLSATWVLYRVLVLILLLFLK